MNQDIERAAAPHDNLRVIFTNASQDIQRQDNEQKRQEDTQRQIADIQSSWATALTCSWSPPWTARRSGR
jgi:hypothetical protein